MEMAALGTFIWGTIAQGFWGTPVKSRGEASLGGRPVWAPGCKNRAHSVS